jgi:hypothetical protein
MLMTSLVGSLFGFQQDYALYSCRDIRVIRLSLSIFEDEYRVANEQANDRHYNKPA